ncbi:hypothetical protein SDC9_190290 [bioreactor metagenome]|uniref:Uncharacterized protein n=1 Tax=bioreactor metagenome TaxID=1076179 RepID=A0A645I5I9_9ZZZZ
MLCSMFLYTRLYHGAKFVHSFTNYILESDTIYRNPLCIRIVADNRIDVYRSFYTLQEAPVRGDLYDSNYNFDTSVYK